MNSSHYLLVPEPVLSIDHYLATEYGGLGLGRAVEIGPEATIDEITQSGLRGRGGGGFPTGRKWSGVRSQSGTHTYLVVNGAEGEPGTFKDRTLMRTNPYQVVEGLMIAAFAIEAVEVFFALKASFTEEYERIVRAVEEMQAAGFCRDCQLTVVSGPDEYLFGEEKAMLEVIEGKPPLPRLLPPYEHGLFVTRPQMGWESSEPEPGHVGEHRFNPTLVNNVETLANVAPIMARGAEWFRSMGTDASPGHLLCTVVGDVRRAGVGEVDLGTPLREVIEQIGGGPAEGRSIKAVFSGVANAVVTGTDLDVAVTYEAFREIDSGMGAGGFIVFDDTACMVEVGRQFSRFLWIESCGQCPACKRGTGEITGRLSRIESGVADETDIEQLGRWLTTVTDGNRCYLPVEERDVVSSLLRSFPEEFDEHLTLGRCPRPRVIRFPKLVDIRDGEAFYDESHYRKRPDWTYEDEVPVDSPSSTA